MAQTAALLEQLKINLVESVPLGRLGTRSARPRQRPEYSVLGTSVGPTSNTSLRSGGVSSSWVYASPSDSLPP